MPDTFDQSTGVYDADADTWTVKVDFDSVYGTLPVPTRLMLSIMAGWQQQQTGKRSTTRSSSSCRSTPTTKDDDGITLTAVMEPWITFDPDGNKFTDNDSTDPRKELQSEIDKLPEVKKDGYTFDGWTKKDKPDEILDIDDVKKLEEPTVLVPKFSANVTFNANGGRSYY